MDRCLSMHISLAPHYLKVYFSRKEWQNLPFAHREQIKYLALRVSEGNYETFVFVTRNRWARVSALIPGIRQRIDRSLPIR